MTICLSPNGANVHRLDGPARRMLVGTVDGVVVLERAAEGWRTAAHTLRNRHICALLREPLRGGVFAAAHAQGLFFSADDGESWEPCMTGLDPGHVFALGCVQESGQTVLYAGTAPPHLFRSDDYGRSWRELPALAGLPGRERWTFGPDNLPHVKHIAFDPRDARTLWVCVEQGALLKSTDGGATWREYGGFYDAQAFRFYKDVHRVVMHPSDPDDLYVTSGDGLLHTPDGGATWERLTTRESRLGYPDAFFFSPTDPGVMFMAGAASFPGSWREKGTADAAFMRSRDGGRSWEPVHEGLPGHLLNNIEAASLASWPGGFGFAIATLDGSVYLSENGGEAWRGIASGLPLVAKAHHHRYLLKAA